MKDLIRNILDLAKLKGASYADIRIVRREFEEIEVKNGNVEALTQDEDFGFGIRLLFQGAWGFACSSKVTKGEMERVLGKALKVARASSMVQGKVDFFPSGLSCHRSIQNPLFNRSVWCFRRNETESSPDSG